MPKPSIKTCFTLAGLLLAGSATLTGVQGFQENGWDGVLARFNPIQPSLAQFRPRPRPTPKPTLTPKPATPTPAATPTVTPTATPTAALSAEATALLQAHNQTRSQLGLPPLQWSPELANYAQDWAKELVATNRFEHRTNGRYGKNLFWASGKRWAPQDVVKSWTDEARFYDYSSNTCQTGKVCGHYTQVIWKKTTQIGCGIARDNRQEIWVCNYNPPGNYIGQKPY